MSLKKVYYVPVPAVVGTEIKKEKCHKILKPLTNTNISLAQTPF